MPSKTSEILPCECYLNYYDNTILVLLKKYILSSLFLFFPVAAREGVPAVSLLQPPASRTVRIQYPHCQIFTSFLAKSHCLYPASCLEREAVEESTKS